jgi:hypothetical protein
MAEAWGKIVIKAPEDLLASLADSEDAIDGQAMIDFFDAVGADTESAAYCDPLSEDDEWKAQNMELHDDHLRIDSVGEEWIPLLEALVKSGRSIEVYGCISHEHGGEAIFALDGKGEPFFAEVDLESGGDPSADVSDAELSEQWRALIPEQFSDYLFADDDDEDDYDDED